MPKATEAADTKIGAAEEMMTIFIDREITRGGLRRIQQKRDKDGSLMFGAPNKEFPKGQPIDEMKVYVGEVTVPKPLAEDLLRQQEEIREVYNAMTNPRQKIRIKSFEVIQQLFLADPDQYESRKGWSKQYGMLDPWQWQTALTEEARQRLIEARRQMYPHLYE